MIRPSRQPCSSPRGDVSFAPARTACAVTVSGSSTTRRVRLVAPWTARGASPFTLEGGGGARLHRGRGGGDPEGCIAAAELRDDLVALADEMQDGRAEGGGVEGKRLARVLNPQLRLDARHRGSLCGLSDSASPPRVRTRSPPLLPLDRTH